MDSEQALKKLNSMSNKKNAEGMKRFGITGQKVLGIQIYKLRAMARQTGKNHRLALKLWDSGIHEAMLLASMIDEPENVSEKQMEKWAKGFESWDLCDQVCMNLFFKVKFCGKKIFDWAERKEEFVKRAGFSLIAVLAVHNKELNDRDFDKYLGLIVKHADDERNYVKKAVNWALRNIGKRNEKLRKKAIKTAEKIKKLNSKSARWIANDALKELSHNK